MPDVSNLPPINEDAARLWVKAEDVAIHFNEMILNFRLKAIGAVTVGAGLFGTILLTKENLAAPRINYMIFAGAMAFLAVVWAGIWAIDFGYYFPLLVGAVNDVIRLEQLSGGTVQLSTLIKKESERRWFFDGPARTAFYVLPLVAFVAAAVLAVRYAPPR